MFTLSLVVMLSSFILDINVLSNKYIHTAILFIFLKLGIENYSIKITSNGILPVLWKFITGSVVGNNLQTHTVFMFCKAVFIFGKQPKLRKTHYIHHINLAGSY
jgi:hypothetical protein